MKNIKNLEEMMGVDGDILLEKQELELFEEWDSITHLSLMIMLQEQYNQEVTGDEIRKLKTVQDVLDIMKE